jgi:hypothetical protein
MMAAKRDRIRKTAMSADMQMDINPYDSIEFFRTPYEIRELFLFGVIFQQKR